mmetsp:Transcript_61440/g.163527  ORF Transcript_61440/g.163527 Transcript_61440/m.163527 type:complete len:224 (+) Transcript_61440:915-1586(+)
MVLHVVQGLSIVQQFIDYHDFVGLLRRSIAKLRTRQIRCDAQRVALRPIIPVGRCLREENRVGARQLATEVRQKHESTLEDRDDNDSFPFAPFLNAMCANANTDLYLLPCKDESVVLEILEVLGSRKRWLVVPIPEWSQKRFGSGPGGLKHCLLSAEHCRFFRKHGPENALDQRRDRQTLDILVVEAFDVGDSRDAHRRIIERLQPNRYMLLFVWKNSVQEIL